MPFGRGWFGRGGMGLGRGMGYGPGMGRGMGYGRGMGPGMGRGNPYPYCRFYPWLPRRWWAYGGGYYPGRQLQGYGGDPYYNVPAPYQPW
jgi:hypothetical protein